MQVLYRLTPVLSHIGDDAVAVFQTAQTGDLRKTGQDMRRDGGVFLRQGIDRGNVLLRNNENMRRSLRRNVTEGEAHLVLKNARRGDLATHDLAKQTVVHSMDLPFFDILIIARGARIFKPRAEFYKGET